MAWVIITGDRQVWNSWPEYCRLYGRHQGNMSHLVQWLPDSYLASYTSSSLHHTDKRLIKVILLFFPASTETLVVRYSRTTQLPCAFACWNCRWWRRWKGWVWKTSRRWWRLRNTCTYRRGIPSLAAQSPASSIKQGAHNCRHQATNCSQ